MPLLKRCAIVINNRSRGRHAAHAIEAALKGYLDRAGVVHHDIRIPNDDVEEQLRRAVPGVEALVLCGGDGTLNSVLNTMVAMSSSTDRARGTAAAASLLEAVPLLLVPTGLHNSVATSLGVTSAERTVSSLAVGHSVRVPLWAVHLHSPDTPPGASPVRYMCSYIAVGTYAAAVQRQGRWRTAQEEYVSLPSRFCSFTATALFTTMTEEAAPPAAACTAVLSCRGDDREGGVATTTAVAAIRLLVASQMPQLQPGYSLTPTATYHRRRLTVATATSEATRLRLWHLLHREAREGYVVAEDGVAVHEDVRGLHLDVAAVSGTTLVVVDGECVEVPAGSRVSVAPTELTARLIVS
ncbi:Diacylglycerol kinase catalytic domain containing protein [Novymonas esmeraldas]|uniref:Diacylglycerol kinase catalytic domain containing protein n=1 Tax=Novymonas esmeraldas TaxID=1808958 RepID=A0AAW0F648_9TRYP